MDANGNPLLQPRLNFIGNFSDDGTRYTQSSTTKKIRMFDEQFNELESELRLYCEKAEGRTSEDGSKNIYTVNILVQDNNQVAKLETNELTEDFTPHLQSTKKAIGCIGFWMILMWMYTMLNKQSN